MSFTDIFIKRPVFSIVLSLIVLLVGLAAFSAMSLRQFPKIESTVVTVSTSYGGASAELMEGFVSAPIENALSGINGVDYITSKNTAGRSRISVYFKLGTDINAAFADVSDKVASTRWKLPEDVDDPTVEKSDPDSMPVLTVSFVSDDMSNEAITDYLTRYVQPELGTLDGVGSAEIYLRDTYAMRIWLNPTRMAGHFVTPADIRNALSKNNLQSPAGSLKNTWQQFAVAAKTDLNTAKQFNNLVIKEEKGDLIRISDVGHAELGSVEPDVSIKVNDQSGTIMGIIARSDGNPLSVAKAVKSRLSQLREQMPESLKFDVLWDSTKFISASINEVNRTIIEATLLVVLVIFLFLGSFRALMVPLVTLPLSLIGVCALMYAMDFSLNTLTLLAMVLAIGMVVDDAIVVLENIHRHLEAGMTPIAASIIGAREIKFAVISMTLTLAAVYAPIGFVTGLTGALFKEFAFTLAAAVIISGFVALTLSPMMCSKLLSKKMLSSKMAHFIDVKFGQLKRYYQKVLMRVLDFRKTTIAFITFILAVCAWLYTSLPGELAPKEDAGAILTIAQGPAGSNLAYTEKYTSQLIPIFKSIPELQSYGIINGIPDGPNSALSFLVLKPWEQRKRSLDEIIASLFPEFQKITGILAFPVNPSRLPGSSGRKPIKFVIKSTGDYYELSEVMTKLYDIAQQNPGLTNLQVDLKFDTPQINVEINRNKAGTLGIPMSDIGSAINLAIGQPGVSRFEMNGQAYHVVPQLEKRFRDRPENLEQIYLKTADQHLVPLSNLTTLRKKVIPKELTHFQQLRAAFLTGSLAPGYTMEQAIDFLTAKANEIMKDNMQYDFAGDMRQFIEASGTMLQVFLFSLIFIFLVLAAQFESFRDPFVVMLSVPLSIAGALVTLKLSGGTINIYSQIGLVTLVGLISKHGILMVEFANELQQQGEDIRSAIVESAAVRLRPILMTTFAMVLGALPLALASGAGAISRQQIGWVIVGGMSFGTLLTLFVVPTMYTLFASKKKIFTTGDPLLDQTLNL